MTPTKRPSASGLVLLVGLTCAAGCKRPEPRPGIDRPLVIVLSPAHAPSNPEGLRASLESASGLRIGVRVAATGDEAIDLVQSGRADSGLVPLFDYLFCAEVFGVQPLLQVLRHGGQSSYQGELVTRADSQLTDVNQLGGHPVGFVDRFSVTGFLLPAKLLKDLHLEVAPTWLGSHQAVIEAVRARRVVAGATYRGHAAADPGLRLLAQTPEVANEPFFVRPQLPEATRLALKRGLHAVGSDSALMAGVAEVSGFREVAVETYPAALATVKAAGHAVENMVPGGWTRANEHRRPLWSYAP